MRVLGVELKANEVFSCLLTSSDGMFDLPDCRMKRLAVQDAASTAGIKSFQFDMAKLVEDYKIEKIVIRGREMKGKFAGSAISFKLEAALQLIDTVDTIVLTPSEIKAAVKAQPIPVRFTDTGLKQFQEIAFTTAYASFIQVAV